MSLILNPTMYERLDNLIGQKAIFFYLVIIKLLNTDIEKLYE